MGEGSALGRLHGVRPSYSGLCTGNQDFILDMLSLRCLLHIQVEILNSQLTDLESWREVLAGHFARHVGCI